MIKETEQDVRDRYISPSIKKSGWTDLQIHSEFQFTDGKVIVNGKRTKRGKQKKADYLLTAHNNFPIAIVEAKSKEFQIDTGIYLRNYAIALPPLEEQKRIVAKIEALLEITKEL